MIIRIFILFLIFSKISYSQIKFEDVAVELGADYIIGESFLGAGVSFVDFDNDGWDDLTYATDDGIYIYFLKNNNGVFNSITFNGISNISDTKQKS